VFNKEEDIGTYTINAVDDPRTLNKILYIRPPMNTYSFNDLVSLWENKIGKTLERIYVPEEQLLKQIIGFDPKPFFFFFQFCLVIMSIDGFGVFFCRIITPTQRDAIPLSLRFRERRTHKL